MKKINNNFIFALCSIMFVILVILLLAITYANELSLNNVNNYSKNNETAIFDNSQATILTPIHNQYTFRGENRHPIIWEIENKEILSKDAIGDVELIDMKTGRPIKRDYYWQYAIYDNVLVMDYTRICQNTTIEINKTAEKTTKEICQNINYQNHTEKQIVGWRNYTSKDILMGNITLGLTIDVFKGDWIDAKPTFFGKKLDRHAEWLESMNEGLIVSYNMNQSSGTLLRDDYMGIYNGTLDNDGGGYPSWEVSSIHDNNLNFSALGEVEIDTLVTNLTGYSAGSIVLFVNFTEDDDNIFTVSNDGSDNNYWQLVTVSGKVRLNIDSGTGVTTQLTSNFNLNDDQYHSIIVTCDGTNTKLYINGTLQTGGTDNGDWFDDISSENSVRIGAITLATGGEQGRLAGYVDEILIYDRALNSTEISDIASRTAFYTKASEDPSIQLNAPINASWQGHNIYFNFTATNSNLKTCEL